MYATTTTSSAAFGALRAMPGPLNMVHTEALDALDAEGLSELARSATLSQNLSAATRLHAAHLLVETLRCQDDEAHDATDTDTDADAEESPRPDHSRPAYSRLDPAAQARDHLAAALAVTCWHAGRLVTAAVQIHTRLPLLRKSVARGLFPEQLAIDTACRLAEIPDEIIGAVESDVVAALARDLDGGHRPSRAALDTAVDAAREQHSPRAASDAADAAAEQRTVRFRPARDGMTTMWASLPSADAEKLRRRIEAAARAASEAGHPRTRNQLRADALCALGDPTTDDIGDARLHHAEDPANCAHHPDPADPADPADCADCADCADRPPLGAAWGSDKPIRISVINSIAQGLPNRVQFVTGAYASFDWLCEELLSGGDARIRFEVIDPQPGVLDKPDAVLKYSISPALAERIRLRDGTCRHPGCHVEADDCELDHAIAFDYLRPELGGPTAEWNLFCLCRKHHREKTFGHSAYQPGPLGELTIITDTGHEHRTTPHGPLAHARDRILDHQWRQHIDRLIAESGYLTNPPGSDRPHHDTFHPA